MSLPPSLMADPLWAHLANNWKPIPKRPGYVVGIAIMGLVVVVLPVIYFALIALTAWGVWWHVTNNGGFIGHTRGRMALGAIALYVAPAIAGVLLVVLMLKPIFAPRARHGREIELAEFEELKLHSFVQNVCAIVGAPTPRQINIDCDVNASASFRSALSMLSRDDMVLTIGMPLVAGMTKRQFAGVLAHEFGHFAQGTGMRVTYVVRTMITWMMRTACERDAWDERMDAAAAESGSGWVTIVVLICKLCVWIARLILRLLGMVAIALCSFMLKQMEYDADRYQVQFAGSKGFGETFNRLGEIGAAMGRAHQECFAAFARERQLPDNMPAYIGAAARRLSPEDREEIRGQTQRETAGLFATHPSTKSRIAHADRLDRPGLYTDDAPARELFGDFDAACKKATIGHFEGLMGPHFVGATLVPTSGMAAASEKEAAREATLPRYLGFDPPTWRPVFPTLTRVPVVEDPKPVVQRLRAARHALKEQTGAARIKVPAYRTAAEESLKWTHARTMMDAGVDVDFKSMGLQAATRNGVSAKIEACGSAAADAAGVIDEAGETAMARLGASLSLLGARGIEKALPDAPMLRARTDALLPAMSALKQTLPMAAAIRQAVACSYAAGATVRNEKTLDLAKKVIRPLSDEIRNKLDDARRLAGTTRDPFAPREEHDEYAPESMTANMGASLVGGIPGWRELDEIMSAGDLFAGRWSDYYRRVLGELVEIGETVERSLARQKPERGEATSTASRADGRR